MAGYQPKDHLVLKYVFAAVVGWAVAVPAGEPQWLSERMHHLRSGDAREWDEFPELAEGPKLELRFQGSSHPAPAVLELRQQDVRRTWKVRLNDALLGDLTVDENDLILHLPIAAGVLRDGENRLEVACAARPEEPSDDIRVGAIRLWASPPMSGPGTSRLRVTVTDAATRRPTPARLTIVTPAGALYPVEATPADRTAVRAGCVYTGEGRVTLRLPAGRYVIYAGRGFEYSIARQELEVAPDAELDVDLAIRRVVPTEGYIACDTHVHSRTHSGHGDATVQERMLTLAGEGIELPIATDHNVQVDHRPFAEEMGVQAWFTPVIGNEVTTKRGHFNIFPIAPDAPTPNHNVGSWAETFQEIERIPGVQVIILNHARDLHSGTRPFGPKLFNAVVGENLQGWPLRMNAMEVINSGATQTAPLQLLHDWMGLLNRGYRVTPIGSSDSHDVNRYIVGQGRTYIRGEDRDPSRLDITAASRSLAEGHVLVSYGLIAELTVAGKYSSGDLVPRPAGQLEATVRVLGPDWVSPRRLLLFANGQLLQEEPIPASPAAPRDSGVLFTHRWILPQAQHDQFLTAIVVGDGIDAAYWRTARPYQPTSPHWESHTLGCSGAVFVDADGDGSWTSAHGYAAQLVGQAEGNLATAVRLLADFDTAIAAHVAHALRLRGLDLDAPEAAAAVRAAAPQTRLGFEQYLAAWRENQLAQFE